MNVHRLTILFVTTFLLAACGATTPAQPAPPTMPELPPTPFLPDDGLHFLIGSSGSETMQLKRLAQGWTSFQPAAWGANIRRGDLIQPPPDGTVTILCADLTVHLLWQEAGSPCKVSQPALFWQGLPMVINPMSPGKMVPFIIHPRNTRILDERPMLHWHDSGASSYTVSIIESGRPIWQQSGVTDTQLRYPASAPSLEPGVNYLLEIIDEDSGISSGQDPMRGLGFQLLTAEETAVVQQKQTEIMALSLDDAAKQFVLAVYYAGQGLYGEALAALDVATVEQESPQIWLWRGKLLVAVRLNDDAETAYIVGATLAEALGDLESQAQAQAGLWHLTGDEGYFNTAVALYRQLGDEQTITHLQNGD